MARPDNHDERDTEWGYGRTQPEFSLGERMATMGANQRKDEEWLKEFRKLEDEHTKQVWSITANLFTEQLKSLRQEMDTKDKAQKEATTKAEKSAADTASALATEVKSSRETTDARLGAIERGGAGIGGEKLGSAELFERERITRAEQARVRANQISMALAGVAILALLHSGSII